MKTVPMCSHIMTNYGDVAVSEEEARWMKWLGQRPINASHAKLIARAEALYEACERKAKWDWEHEVA